MILDDLESKEQHPGPKDVRRGSQKGFDG